MDIVFAKQTLLAAHPRHGGVTEITEGSHWLADDPLVAAYPDLFSDEPKHGLRASEPLDQDGYPPFAVRPVEGELAESDDADAGTGEATNAETGQVTKPGEELPPVTPDQGKDAEKRSTTTATETADATPGTKRTRQRNRSSQGETK